MELVGQELTFTGAEFRDHLGRIHVIQTGHPNKDRQYTATVERELSEGIEVRLQDGRLVIIPTGG